MPLQLQVTFYWVNDRILDMFMNKNIRKTIGLEYEENDNRIQK